MKDWIGTDCLQEGRIQLSTLTKVPTLTKGLRPYVLNLLALPTRRHNPNTRGFNPGNVQTGRADSPSGSVITTSQASHNPFYLIVYPIESECTLCDFNCGNMNLKIRQHVIDEHAISNFQYGCKLCYKNYETINGVKAHYTACKRLPVTTATATTTTTTATTTATTTTTTTATTTTTSLCSTTTPSTTDPFQCTECLKSSIIKIFKDRKGLTTHMRIKHAEEYEISKTVASKRIAWSIDEDRVLAKLELSLKEVQRGQILSRLYIGYNEIAAKSKAPSRSKEAIRGRRQQPDYKALMNEMIDELDTNSDSDDTSSENSLPAHTTIPASNCNIANFRTGINKYLEDMLKDKSKRLSDEALDAIQEYLRDEDSDEILTKTMKTINKAIDVYREKHPPKSKHGKPMISKNKKPIKNAKRQESARTHGYYQKLFYENEKKLVTEILDGESSNINPPPIAAAETYYKAIWSKPSKDDAPFESKTTANTEQLFAPITKEEIDNAIRNTNKDSAPGPDLVNWFETKGIVSELTTMFNIWLGIQRIPNQLKENKTILIPKSNTDQSNIKNWRPITISSMILRTYNKILGYRMNRVFKTNDKQVGFKPINGCGINVLWLHSLLKHARKNKNNIYACLIDVSKAFDSVSHESITRALKRNGTPTAFINIITDQYTNASTVITYNDAHSQKIDILCGVKQGDPLSSILFNLIIDELFDVLQDDHGYSIHGIGQTNARCFADDLCLISSTRIGMGELLRKTNIFLTERGLSINPAKCITIGLAKGYKGKKSKIETESLFNINGTPIPMLGYTDKTCRYLGINFTSVGAVDSRRIKHDISEALQKITKLKLKAQCKLKLLRTYVIPRFIYQLVNSEIYPSFLKRIDICVRKAVRSILHLPMSLSNEIFHLPMKEGGLQFPDLSQIVGIAKIRLFKKITLLGDPVLKHLIEDQGNCINEKFIVSLKIGGTHTANEISHLKDQMMKDKRASYAEKVHSMGQEIFATCPLTNQWIQGNLRTMRTRTFINSIKLRTNSLETKVTTTRGLDTIKTCRKCNMADESLMHLLQCCPATKGLRYVRHHKICSRVSNKLIARGYQVFREKSFPDPNRLGCTLRPDIIAIKDKQVLILDVSAVYERTGATFINAYQTKVTKYEPILNTVKHQFECSDGKVHGLIIGSRGSYYHNHLHIWYQLGLSTMDLKFIAIGCMEDSIKIASLPSLIR